MDLKRKIWNINGPMMRFRQQPIIAHLGLWLNQYRKKKPFWPLALVSFLRHFHLLLSPNSEITFYCTAGSYSRLALTFKVSRISLPYELNILFPIGTLTVLCLASVFVKTRPISVLITSLAVSTLSIRFKLPFKYIQFFLIDFRKMPDQCSLHHQLWKWRYGRQYDSPEPVGSVFVDVLCIWPDVSLRYICTMRKIMPIVISSAYELIIHALQAIFYVCTFSNSIE